MLAGMPGKWRRGLTIFVRIWAAFALVLLIGGLLMFNALQTQLRPSAKAVIEDSLVDNAHLVASLIAPAMAAGRLGDPKFDRQMQAWLNQTITARIGNQYKTNISQHLYVTNVKGKVIYDSRHLAEGQDYSRWNDVYLALRGGYGVRSTRVDPADPNSSSMYVAAPIRHRGRVIGVVTLIKPGRPVQTFIEAAEAEMVRRAMQIGVVALVVAAAMALWLRSGIEQVRRFALPQGDQPLLDRRRPRFRTARELNDLVQSIDDMRTRLAGKAYVEQTMQTLTHELKSPLTAINASAELLRDDLPAEDRQYFAHSIGEQARRLTHLVDQMLLLSRAEQHNLDLQREPIHLAELFAQLKSQRLAIIRRKQVDWQDVIDNQLILQADRFWFTQMLGNLLDNALDFINDGGLLQIQALPEQDQLALRIFNSGQLIPEFALEKVREAYFSLPRPGGQGKRSSGLGLTLVDRIVTLHGGAWVIGNQAGPEGVFVSIRLPLGQERVRAVQTR